MIFRSPYPDITIPDLPLTQFVLQHAERLAGKPALIDGATGRTLTYGQLADGVRRTAVGLALRGFRKGEVFATIVPNIPEFALVYYGVATLGGATTMLNPLLTIEEMAGQLADAGARFVLTVPERFDVVREAADRAGVDEVFVLGEAARATPFAALLERDGPLPAVAIDPAADVVVLPYSSGTTGRPKGVMLTHHNQMMNVLIWQAIERRPEDDTVVSAFPLFHVAGTITLNRFLHAGSTVVLMPRYDFQTFLRLLQDYRATEIAVAPPIALELSRHPSVEDYDLSRLQLILWAAAPLSQAVERTCRERFGCRMKQVYGLTEASGATHGVPSDADDRPGSAGPPLPGIECKIVDLATGAALAPGQTGEVCVRGPIVMKGYLNDPEATARTIDADCWLHTGDLGYADEDGWLYVVDRLKELIKYNAYQVAPAELEAVLMSHPAVADAAVIPSPDERAGEIPKSPSGKILRRILVERERANVLSLV